MPFYVEGDINGDMKQKIEMLNFEKHIKEQ